MEIHITGILGLLIFIAEIWAIVNIVQSKEETLPKVLWVAFLLILPVFALFVWWFTGPRRPETA